MANSDMREWLRDQGHAISDRGRVAKPLQDLYYARNLEPTEDEPTGKGAERDALKQIMKPTGKSSGKRSSCGFCTTGGKSIDYHKAYCPGSIKNGSKAPEPVWYCWCAENEHTLKVPIPGRST